MAVKYNKEDIRRYIAYVAPLIRAEATKRGYAVCSTVIAQSVIEGGCGMSQLAMKYHNLFGLKCGQSWMKAKKPAVNMKTGEFYSGSYVTINDWFRAYSDDIAGISGYYDFIASSRYSNLRTASDYIQYAKFLKADGYATSPTYVQTLTSFVEAWGLIQYDHQPVINDGCFPMYEGASRSIVEALKAVGADGSRKARAKIYAANFSDQYEYTAEQNLKMLDALKNGTLKRF